MQQCFKLSLVLPFKQLCFKLSLVLPFMQLCFKLSLSYNPSMYSPSSHRSHYHLEIITLNLRDQTSLYMIFCYTTIAHFTTEQLLILHQCNHSFHHPSSSQSFGAYGFIRYIYNWNLLFLNNVTITKTKVFLPQVNVTLAWLSCSGTLVLISKL